MNAAPPLTFETPANASHSSLKGWEERRRWGILNEPLWHRVYKEAAHSGISEEDTLRVLAVTQADEIECLKAQLKRVHETRAFPRF